MGFLKELLQTLSGSSSAQQEYNFRYYNFRYYKLKATNDIRIVNESIKIIKNTKKSSTRKSRLQMARAHLDNLKYIVQNQPRISVENLDRVEKELQSLERKYNEPQTLLPGIVIDPTPRSDSLRDTDRGPTKANAQEYIRELEPWYNSSTTYEPQFCYLADAFYKIGDYERALQMGLDLHERAKLYEWHSNIPTSPLDIAGKALRALAKQSIKGNNPQQAIRYFERLETIERITEHDKKILTRLRYITNDKNE